MKLKKILRTAIIAEWVTVLFYLFAKNSCKGIFIVLD